MKFEIGATSKDQVIVNCVSAKDAAKIGADIMEMLFSKSTLKRQGVTSPIIDKESKNGDKE